MRLDLTNASYRVLRRASQLRLSGSSSEIDAAKLLIALFEEEECRGADWLFEAGLSLKMFYEAFHLREGMVRHGTMPLRSPISAPSFPMGNYGVPPEAYSGQPPSTAHDVDAAAWERESHVPGYVDRDELSTEENPEKRSTETPSEMPRDEWSASSETDSKSERTYSIFPNDGDRFESSLPIRARFYLDDQMVRIGRLSRNLESTLEILLQRFSRSDETDRSRRISAAGGGIANISIHNDDFPRLPFPLATEHLLWAVVMDERDVGHWLRDHEFDPVELHQRIDGLSRCQQGENLFDAERAISNLDPADDDLDLSSVYDSGALKARRESTEKHAISLPESFNDVGEKGLVRLFDAAANRAQEAIRVIEDFVRFVLDDSELTRQVKDIRHDLREALEPLSLDSRLKARDTLGDVGTELEGSGEYHRETIHDVLMANFVRLQESLRSLEEFSKLVEPGAVRRLERLRYRCYTLHQVVFEAETSRGVELASSKTLSPARLLDFDGICLYALTDARKDETEFVQLVRALVGGGVNAIQLRDKAADDRTLLQRARILHEIVQASDRSILFVMNDRPDLALIGEADGVHVGQDELPITDVRRIVGQDMIIGVSTHNIAQARQAVLEGADYIGAGPIFESSTKNFSELAGLEFLREVAAEIVIPVFAIGGITTERVSSILETGISRIAVGAALSESPDPKSAAKEFIDRLKGA